jgi:hypothetical protein
MKTKQNLFEQFRAGMPSNEILTSTVLKELAGEQVTPAKIKKDFSTYVDKVQTLVYRNYLKAEEVVANKFLKNILLPILRHPF